MAYVIHILPAILSGLDNTFKVFIITFIFSIPAGVMVALGRNWKFLYINQLFSLYIYVLRGTPLLLQIIFIYYGLPAIGIVFDRFTAVYIAFILNYAAYFGEIFRGGINSIDKGQYEAAAVLGISRFKTFYFIILPQVVKRTLPAVANEVITLVKDTSLIYVVGIAELLLEAKVASNRDATLVPFLLAGVIYLLITSVLTRILTMVEKRFAYYE